MGGTLRAPLQQRGFWGGYSKRGRAELKYQDTEGAPGGIPNSGQTILLNFLAQGTGVNQRVGRKCVMKSFLMRYGIYPSASTSAANGTIVRAMIVYDRSPNNAAALPAITDVLASATWDSALNLAYRERFLVLWDKTYTIGATQYTTGALTAGNPKPVAVQKYKKINLPVIFGGTGGDIVDISTGSLFLLEIGNINATVTSDWRFRLRFTDE